MSNMPLNKLRYGEAFSPLSYMRRKEKQNYVFILHADMHIHTHTDSESWTYQKFDVGKPITVSKALGKVDGTFTIISTS